MTSPVGVKTNEQLTLELRRLRTQFDAIVQQFSELQQNVNSRPRLSDLGRSETSLKALIDSNSESINTLERQIGKVILPEDTRFYLSESEISDFRSNFSKLLAMMAQFETLYNNLVAYQSNVTGADNYTSRINSNSDKISSLDRLYANLNSRLTALE